jgi:hypothetical protein
VGETLHQIQQSDTNESGSIKLGKWVVNPSSYRNYSELVHFSLDTLIILEQSVWYILDQKDTTTISRRH